eukprot:3752882-Amphidinium_carterae.1
MVLVAHAFPCRALQQRGPEQSSHRQLKAIALHLRSSNGRVPPPLPQLQPRGVLLARDERVRREGIAAPHSEDGHCRSINRTALMGAAGLQ